MILPACWPGPDGPWIEGQATVKIEFVFDTACPWCYVGKRRFERAMALRPHARFTVQWRPFLLNPDMPLDGMDRDLYLDRKFGGVQRAQRMYGAVTSAGDLEGIDFLFDRILRTPNTLHSHRLIRFATLFGRASEAVEAVLASYFTQGLDIGELTVLVAIGRQLGLPAAELVAYLTSDADIAQMMNDNARAHRLGVNGVPCVIVDGAYALAGAHEPDVLLRLIDIASEAEAEPALS